MDEIVFRAINKNSEVDIKKLYEILKKRDFNISHTNLPDFKEHNKFVLNYSYRIWNFIENEKSIIGNFYITYENVISIILLNPNKKIYVSIIKKIIEQFSPLKEKKSIRSKYFLFNTNPKNIEYIKALESLNLDHIQNTYAYKKKLYKNFL